MLIHKKLYMSICKDTELEDVEGLVPSLKITSSSAASNRALLVILSLINKVQIS